MTVIKAHVKRLSAALTAAALIALAACGSDDTESDDSSPDESAAPSAAAVDGFPVGEPFGDAEWSVEVSLPSTGATVKMRDSAVKVRGDRVIAEYEETDGRGVIAFDASGEEVWKQEVSESARIGVLEETVAVLEQGTEEGSGLEKDQSTTTLTLLSLKDGSTVTESDEPDLSLGNSITEFGEIVTLGEPRKYITEDGDVREAEEYPEDLAKAIPDLEDGLAEIVPLDSGIDELDDAFAVEVRAISRQQNVALLQVAYGGAEWATYAVEAESGEVITKLDCRNAEHTDSDTNVAYSSPNGEYGVMESYWISEDDVRCYAGDEETKGVEFSAVDDDGTAYGVTSESDSTEGELAVVTADGEADVSALPDGAPAPLGIADGGMAIHVKGNTITGNPIK